MTRFIATIAIFLISTLGAGAQQKKGSVDDQIYDQVKLKLAADPMVNGGALDVDVKNAIVTLKGRVRTERARMKAEKVAAKVKGVKSVDNQIRVDTNAH